MIFGLSEEEAMGKANMMCGECVRFIPECPWMSKGNPVDGWTAEEAEVKLGYKSVKTYHITDCPLFIPHPRSTMFGQDGKRL